MTTTEVDVCTHIESAICWLCAPEGEGPSWWRDVPGYGTNRGSRERRREAPVVNRAIYVESVDPFWYRFCPFLNVRHSEDRWRVKFIHGAVVYCGAHLPHRYRDLLDD